MVRLLFFLTIALLALHAHSCVSASSTERSLSLSVSKVSRMGLQDFRVAQATIFQATEVFPTKAKVKGIVDVLMSLPVAADDVPDANYLLLDAQDNRDTFRSIYQIFVMYLPQSKWIRSDPIVVENLRNHLKYKIKNDVMSFPSPFIIDRWAPKASFRSTVLNIWEVQNRMETSQSLHKILEALKSHLRISLNPPSSNGAKHPGRRVVNIPELKEYLIRIVQIIYESETYNTFQARLDQLFRQHLIASDMASTKRVKLVKTQLRQLERTFSKANDGKLKKGQGKQIQKTIAEAKATVLRKEVEKLRKLKQPGKILLGSITHVMKWITEYVELEHKLK